MINVLLGTNRGCEAQNRELARTAESGIGGIVGGEMQGSATRQSTAVGHYGPDLKIIPFGGNFDS
jgi:hypothetical protein